MIFENTMLVVASILMSVTISHICWVKVRVMFLREEFFLIRDQLWDRARELEALDDPAYREAREHCNAMIRAATMISYASVIRLFTVEDETSMVPAKSSLDAEMQKAIVFAYDSSANVILKYILYHTIAGWLAILLYFVWRVPSVIRKHSGSSTQQLTEICKRWVHSDEPETFARIEGRPRRELSGLT